MSSLAIVDTYQPSGVSSVSQLSDGIQGRQSLEAQRYIYIYIFFFNLECEESPLQPLQTPNSLQDPIQYPNEVIGSRGGSLWKLSNFFSSNLVSDWSHIWCLLSRHCRDLSAFKPLSSIIAKCWGPLEGYRFFSNLESEEMPSLTIVDIY